MSGDSTVLGRDLRSLIASSLIIIVITKLDASFYLDILYKVLFFVFCLIFYRHREVWL